MLYSRSSHSAIAATWTAPSASPISNHTFYGKRLRNCMSKFLLSSARHRNSLHWSFTTQCFRYYLNLSTCASTSSEIHSSFCYRRKRSNNVSLVGRTRLFWSWVFKFIRPQPESNLVCNWEKILKLHLEAQHANLGSNFHFTSEESPTNHLTSYKIEQLGLKLAEVHHGVRNLVLQRFKASSWSSSRDTIEFFWQNLPVWRQMHYTSWF